ncbi:hypothetical protein QTG54_009303 [Skeletonema marinoi]|uniref:MORN repeat-containing protein 5 n=1 Tax=Skeletonema marinoi TaxID=267567 RepID=A0AAD9DC41_9STRA|nr:hypothetical protein QTG54_009303 [Skeletonema marinoi]
MWRIIAILLSIAGAVSSNPGAGAEGAPMVPTIQYQCKCGVVVVQSVATSDTDYGKVDDNDLMNEHIHKETDGTVSEGQSKAKDGLTYGEGTCTWVDGNIYDGELLFGKPHGDGKMKYKDGSEYAGGWLEGKQHGAGTITSMWQLYRYQGGWSYGEPHGKGVVAWFWNFIKFEGEYEDGQLVDVSTVRFSLLLRLIVVHKLLRRRFGLVLVLLCIFGWRVVVDELLDLYLRLLFLFYSQRRELAEVKAAESKEELDDDESINDEDE